MDRKKRLLRVVMLMAAFARNLAYFRALKPFQDRIPKASWDFWMTLSNNALDMAVLEWCKLFASANDKHHWSKVVTDPAVFEADMLKALDLSDDGFDHYLNAMRRYRDKFVAHLDSDEIMDIPELDLAEHAVRLYFTHLIEKEVEDAVQTLKGLPSSPATLVTYFKDEWRKAEIIYETALQPRSA